MNFARFTGVKNTFFKYSVPQQVSDQIRAKLEFLIFSVKKIVQLKRNPCCLILTIFFAFSEILDFLRNFCPKLVGSSGILPVICVYNNR